ncbi:MAG: VWA domain-containing protein [Terriglobales bacterium]
MRCLLAVLLICTSASPQQPTGTDGPHKDDSTDFVVRINVNLVQVDAVVTDAKGSPVTGLTAKDFEVLQDGVPQTITNFSYVAEGMRSTSALPAPSPAKTDLSIPVPPIPLTREHVRRTIVLMVDDLGLSLTGVAYVRVALKKFVDHDMQPGDIVAIVRTGGGVGALQQLTKDKRLLYAAIDQVKFHFMARAASFAPVDLSRTLEAPSEGSGGSSAQDGNAARYATMDIAEKCMLDTNSAFGSLAAIRYVVQGLRDVPGRKALILLSEKLQISDRPDLQDSPCEPYRRVGEILRKVTDTAERSAVVIYTIDPHGLDPLVPDATSNPFGGGPLKTGTTPEQVLINNQREMSIADFYGKIGLQELADATGGTFAFHSDTAGAIREAVNDSSSYYLLGYRPPASTFEGKDRSRRFHHVTVKLKRPGLRVRSRTGFYGYPGREHVPSNISKEQQFARVLMSPFAENDIHLRTTTFFSELEKPLLTTFIYIDTKDLTFAPDADGNRKAALNAISVTFDKNGTAVDNIQRTYTLSTNEQDYALAQNGALLTLQQTAQKPGPYQVRVVILDVRTGKFGSANQFVEVPDLNRGRLALSGILLKRFESGVAGASKDASRATPDTYGNEATRIFKLGETIRWYYQIFNAKSGPDQRADLGVQVRVFRDGSPVMRSELASAHLFQNPQAKYLATSGHMVLGQNFTPGDYALQLVVTDELAKKKYSTASQSIDFEVENP